MIDTTITITYSAAGTDPNRVGLFARVPASNSSRKVSGGCKNLVIHAAAHAQQVHNDF